MLSFLPGVPIFFFVSGYLISASYERSKTHIEFYRNRALRIFPGLWLCLALSVFAVWVSGYFGTIALSWREMLIWLGAQASFAQFYNPEFLRGYGVGVLNGSLWTISVELQFYLMIPLVFLVYRASRGLFVACLAAFVGANLLNSLYLSNFAPDRIETKLFAVTFLPWIAPFLIGFLASKYRARIMPLCEGKLVFWALVYAALIGLGIFIENATGYQISGNWITPLHYIPIGFLILACAYTGRGLSDRLLRRNDISYGVYIYHMPVINFWLYLGLRSGFFGLIGIILGSVALATFSWVAIERPAQRMKHVTLIRR